MADIIDAYEMTPLQAGMLFHTLYTPESGGYFEQYWCVLEGPLDVERFRHAWQQVINRHAVLRSECHWDGLDQPAQVIYDAAEPEWQISDWSDSADTDRDFSAWLAADRRRGFDLNKAPLLRFALFRLGEGRHRFVWSFHHLLMDGWCGALLVREMLRRYSGGSVPPAPASYRRYIEWRADQNWQQAELYWRRTLAGLEGPTPLGIDRTFSGHDGVWETRERLPAALSNDLDAFARRNRLTLNTLLQGAWALLLARYSGGNDVVYGVVQSGRPPDLSGAEDMIGLFLNTVPVRIGVDPARDLVGWLEDLQVAQRDRERFGHVALTDIQQWSGVSSATPLFDSLLIVENYPISIESAFAAEQSELTVCEKGSYEQTHYPLTLKVLPGETIEVSLNIDTRRIARAAAERLMEHFKTVLGAFAANPDARLDDIEIIGSAERERLLDLGRGPDAMPAASVPVQIAARAALAPKAVAVEFESANGSQSLTYAEFVTLGNAIAARLHQLGAGPGMVVAVSMERSRELPAALFGVLSSGAAYLPIDPSYPLERIDYVLDDSGATLALVDAPSQQKLAALSSIRTVTVADCVAAGAPYVAKPVDADDIAYMIYTSGSTGRPKGVPIRHGSLANFLQAMTARPGMSAADRLLAVTTVAFDIAALELFGPLVNGGTVVLADPTLTRDGELLAGLLDRKAISVMQATPAGWRLLIEAGWQGRSALTMLCGGEALDSSLARDLLTRGRGLWNLYGPTETAIWSGALPVTSDLLDQPTVPLGGPIDNTQFHLLDPQGRAVPFGIPGELHIGGAGLSPGYHRKPELTAEKFLTDMQGGKLYRTGDRMCYRDDGTLEFLGRLDGQIKLRGFRIELGEIEARLVSHALVAQAIAVVRDDGAGPQITAYFRTSAAAGGLVDRDALTAYLAASLPDYMVPTALMVLETFPLTPNGKIDRAALPAPERGAAGATSGGGNVIVQLVGDIWAEALGLPAVGANENFFDLGGHSLLATRVLGQIQRATGLAIELRDLFEAPVLQDFCGRIAKAQDLPAFSPLAAAPGNAVPRLSFAQQRQWLIAKLDPVNPAYIIPIAVRLRGALHPRALEQALSGLAARHDVLRSVFPDIDGTASLTIAPVLFVSLSCEDLTDLPPAAREQAVLAIRNSEVTTTFDLATGPVWRARLLRVEADEHILLLTLHHILADEWSLDIILRDLINGYAAALTGSEGPKKAAVQYADFALWQRDLDLSKQLASWRDILKDAPALLALPVDRPRPARRSNAGSTVEFLLPPVTAAALRKMARSNGVTFFMLLLAAYYVFLHRHSGSDDIVVGTPVANRRQADVQGLIGLFVNTLALRIHLDDDPSFATLLARVREAVLSADARQDIPFEQVLDALELPRSASHQPLFQVLFSFQTLPDGGRFHDDLTWAPLPAVSVTSKFDLSLAWRETPEGLLGRFEYPVDLFDEETVQAFAARMEHMLVSLPGELDCAVGDLPLLPRDERDLLEYWAHGPQPQIQSRTLQAAFAAQAQQTPDAVALAFRHGEIDYAALLTRVARLAGYLAHRGVERGDRIGLWIDDSPETIIALLAILWRGAAYVPLDPDYPQERLRWMVADAGLRLTVAATAGPLPGIGLDILSLKARENEIAAADPLPPAAGDAEDLAYILYTSGSTGRPKGVCTPHRGVIRLVKDVSYVSLSPDETLLQSAPLTFDASTFEIFGALLNGGKLALTAGGDGSLASLGTSIVEMGVTTLWLTAGLFHLVADEWPDIVLPLRQLLAGGDRLSLSHVRKLQALASHLRIVNGYGPTETTTFACCYTIPPFGGQSAEGTPAIGRPINGTELRVLDRRGVPAPPGVSGELYIGGSGVARGYLNRADLTAEQFLPNPFSDPRSERFGEPETCLYRTGDKVRFAPDGALLYLGRLDDQVKIRGFRIEPGEIEAALALHPALQASVVAINDRDSLSRRLIAYLIIKGDNPRPSDAGLRAFLLERLPDYMVPAHFVWLDRLPLTVNGKVDRRALPSVESESAGGAPEGDVEQMLAGIWSGVLKVDAVGRTDNFFDLGGDSILAMQIVSRAARKGLSLEPRHLFEHQTVAELAIVALPVSQPDEKSPAAIDLLTPGSVDMDALLASISFTTGETADS